MAQQGGQRCCSLLQVIEIGAEHDQYWRRYSGSQRHGFLRCSCNLRYYRETKYQVMDQVNATIEMVEAPLRAEIKALKAERDDLKRQLTALPVYDPSYGDAVVLITDLKAERDKLRAALEEIASMEGYADYGQCDIARCALEESK